jgi:peptide/bleomycin uptake transporter
MIKSFFFSREHRLFAWLVLGLLIGLAVAQVYMTVLFNDWYKEFYNSLELKNYDLFIHQLKLFGGLASIAIILATFSRYIAQHYTFRWRQAITYYYLHHWNNNSSQIEGSSQRIQEDTMKFASTTYGLVLGFFKAILTLLAFIPILWDISKNILILGQYQFSGFLVWVALVVSIGGMIISFYIGRKLPMLEYNNQKTEAAFRKSLVYGEDKKETLEQQTLWDQFSAIKANYFALFNNFKYFTIWENFYSQAGVIIPYVVAAPTFFAGAITLGVLVQVGNAFDKVHDSFSFFLQNWITVNELRSVVMRLREFEKTLTIDTR